MPNKDSNCTFCSYSTPLLELTEQAIKKLWLNVNAKDFPKQETVIEWLMTNSKSIIARNITKREAAHIDAIIANPGFRKGGNRKR